MPNIAQAIKAEIVRLSRKEVKAAIKPIHNSNFTLKKAVWDLKKKVAILETENRKLLSIQKQPKVPKEVAGKARITSRGIRKLRIKLGLSQELFSKLLGVSSQAVYSMEHKEGKMLRLRPATLSNMLSVRKLGKREVKKRLEEIENSGC